MFTGIIEEVGRIFNRTDRSLKIRAQKVLNDIKVGDSIAVNGVCLTVLSIDYDSFVVELLPKTAILTNLKEVEYVNLERAMKLSDRIGGHILTGHIDFKSKLKERINYGNFLYLCFEIEDKYLKYFAPFGSVGVDGVSLTVMELKNRSFVVHLTEYSQKSTTLGKIYPEYFANIELDILAKYVNSAVGRYV